MLSLTFRQALCYNPAMRVIAGKARGTRLVAPRGLHVRPTLDRVKTAMFNILAERVLDTAVLDVFSGSGALGIEALSRGASSCTFVERSQSCVAAIRANLNKAGLAAQARVVHGNVFGILRRLPLESVFDLGLAAPPYRVVDEAASRQQLWRWLVQLVTSDRFADDGTVVLEHRRQRTPLVFPEEIELFDSRTYGDTTLSLLGRRN